MSENLTPVQYARLDLAAVNNNKRSSATKGARSRKGIGEVRPMATERMYNVNQRNNSATDNDHASDREREFDTSRMQLISPPPEEMLRRLHDHQPSEMDGTLNRPGSSASKRKRREVKTPKAQKTSVAAASGSSTVLANEVPTPNPKPRKQVRRQKSADADATPTDDDVEMESPTKPRSTRRDEEAPPATPTRKSANAAKMTRLLLKSPHERNPDADYIPPVTLLARLNGADEGEEQEGIADLNVVGSAVKKKLLSARGSRRSVTPIPHYEPPTDVFTPPREVFMSPPQPPSRRTRSSRKKAAVALTPVVVKMEKPTIDLSAPMPPPSPTDDPLLLSSDIEITDYIPPRATLFETPVRQKQKDVSTTAKKRGKTKTPGTAKRTVELESTSTRQAAQVVVMEEMGTAEELPPSSPLPDHSDEENVPKSNDDDDDDGENFDWTKDAVAPMEYTSMEDDSMMQVDSEDARVEPVRILDFDQAVKDAKTGGGPDGWSDSEDEADAGKGRKDAQVEGEGEYTGKWRMMKVRTKADPPSSATKSRMDIWGRPISPFPKVSKLTWDVGGITEEEETQVPVEVQKEKEVLFSQLVDQESDEEEEREVLRMSIEPEEIQHQEPHGLAQEKGVDADDDDAQVANLSHMSEEDEEEEVERLSMELEPDEEQEEEQEHSDAEHTEVYFDTVVPIPTTPEDTRSAQTKSIEDDDDDDDLSDFEDLGIVKIVSADPRAAARAAAILKQYDYDCFTRITVKQRKAELKRRHSSVSELAQESRRRSLLSSGIDKHRERRRSMGVIGDRVIIPGSPSTTLPELLERAEKEVAVENASPEKRNRTPERLKDPFSTPRTMPQPFILPAVRVTEGPRAWTKEEWKILDSCFTDERMDIADDAKDARQELASVDDVSVERIADRFVDIMGGDEVVKSYGAAWGREPLLQRVKALQKKQRAGKVAPPSTPRSPSETSSSSSLGGRHRTPSMEVPDFTPLGRRAMPPRKPRASLPEPVSDKSPFSNLPSSKPRLPATLLAPRYSHLLDEAISVNSEVSHLAEKLDSSPDNSMTDEGTSMTNEEPSMTIEEPSMTVEELSITIDSPVRLPVAPKTPSFGKRLKGALFSYLPTLSRTAPAGSKSRRVAQPGLPLPPLEILEKPRGPIETPVRQAIPKAPHPKELVELHPAPQKPSMLRRPKQLPQRLVDLQHVSPPPEPAPVHRPRRSSSGSVKDLIKNFEELKEQPNSRPQSSLGHPKKLAASRPAWKP
ncbi:hypothetical protein FA15DRAFT_760509 [Coprinopsis marcescibilis]|uniref:Uncharacterized protein n=1 Tax=Coprinopsis marcescibilis TaxID=230819 RepID=A0A5C3KFS2_COPMA|nr:hypothetical protein FA15DRAFT_760509 [Coprinopsis marcescibilis]